MTFRSVAIGAAALALIAAGTLPAAAMEAPLRGIFALPGADERTTGVLTVRETGPLAREIEVRFADKATGKPITRYDEELTKELHVLATDSALSTFVHEHTEKAEPDGRFRVQVRFPKPGLYHLYADAAPSGLGQQVIRFDVPVEMPAGRAAMGRRPAMPAPTGPVSATLEGSDGPYTVKLEAPGLRAGAEGMMTLTILKDGQAATDLGPYLGAPAHAVFIGAEDLAYVHAHAMAADEAMGNQSGGQGDHASHGGAKVAIPAKLMLHATPPRAGRYALWIQFMGGGQVRTVPFAVTVPTAA